MSLSIGELLGGIVAHLENELLEDVRDEDVLRRLVVASEIYRNFAAGDLEGFSPSFKQGYDQVVKEFREIGNRVYEPDRRFEP